MAKTNIAVIDYGAGNILNVLKALSYIGLDATFTQNPDDIANADAIILPGVGAFAPAMAALNQRQLIAPIQSAVQRQIPLLGVCLGMQLLFDSSTEHGDTKGLGLIPGDVVPIPTDLGVKVPHMGWNQNHVTQSHPLANPIDDEYTYFVHSYYAKTQAKYILSETNYGIAIPSLVGYQNVFGAQFHPEKSSTIGLEVLRQFGQYVNANKESI